MKACTAHLQRLLPGFDVVVTDGPGDDLLEVNPALVVCSITGFGTAGAFARAPADDWPRWPRPASSATSPAGSETAGAPSTARAPRRYVLRRDARRPRRAGRPPARTSPAGPAGRPQHAARGSPAARTRRSGASAERARSSPSTRPRSSIEAVSDAINPLAHHRDPREGPSPGCSSSARTAGGSCTRSPNPTSSPPGSTPSASNGSGTTSGSPVPRGRSPTTTPRSSW